MNTVTYVSLCPICLEGGNHNRLSCELGNAEVFCEAGHKFGSLEEAESFSALSGESAATLPEVPTEQDYIASLNAVLQHEEFEEQRAKVEVPPDLPSPEQPTQPPAVPDRATQSAADPPSVDPRVVDEYERAQAIAASFNKLGAELKRLDGTEAAPPKPTKEEFVFGGKPKNGRFIPPPPMKLPGGDLLLTIRIPEQHATFLAAECEVQKETIGERMQRMILFGLEAGWFF